MSQGATTNSVKTNTLRLSDGSWCRTLVESKIFSFVWKIENFTNYISEGGSLLESSVFSFKTGTTETRWQLQLYPYGDDKNVTENFFISLFLRRVDEGSDKIVEYELSLLGIQDKIEKVLRSRQKFSGQALGLASWGYKKFILRKILFEKASTLLPNDQLTICCKLTAFIGTSKSSGMSKPSSTESSDHLSEDMNTLVDNMRFSDVEIVVGGRVFQAHKAILAARSSVFATMFTSDMSENKENSVKIEDIQDKIFEKVLTYIYTGKKPIMNTLETAEAILYSANKYMLGDLKKMCEVNLSQMVTKGNASKLRILADTFDLKYLNDVATKFLVPNMVNLIESEEWKMMSDEQLKVGLEVLQKAANKRLRTS